MIKRLILAGLLLVLLVAGGVGLKVRGFLSATPSTEHTEKVIQIPRGASVGAVARLLQEQGVVTNAEYFRRYVAFQGSAERIRAGEFRFYTDLTPAGVLDVLINGQEVTYKLTFPEGYNYRDMLKVVATLDFLDPKRFEQLVTDPAVVKKYGFTTPTLEGFLFPSTYEITRTHTEEELVSAMVRQFKAHWTPEFDSRAKSLGMSQLEVVTLASIVEKETGRGEERPQVASVFHNRLKKGMKLESDPTIIYGLENYDGDIRRSDIRRPHPWNTYVIPALPPSPIANPGEAAIRATLFPAETDYLYFVATGDGNHSFSKTFAEHAAKVLEYQIRLRGQGRKQK
jgi:UPF0755 protein